VRTAIFAAFVCLLAGCAGQPPAPVVASTGAKPACNTSAAPTGSHMVDHSCTAGNAVSISGDSMQTSLRQANQGFGGGH
jgi:hypothetical protein